MCTHVICDSNSRLTNFHIVHNVKRTTVDTVQTTKLWRRASQVTRGCWQCLRGRPQTFARSPGPRWLEQAPAVSPRPAPSSTSSSSIPDATTSSSESASPPCQATAGTRMKARGVEKEDVRIVKNLCHELSAQGYPSNLIQRRELGQVSVSHSVD